MIRDFSLFLKGLVAHVGHELTWVTHGDPPAELSVECLTCGAVLYHIKVLDLEPETPCPQEAR
jgi:hypothetical protein